MKKGTLQRLQNLRIIFHQALDQGQFGTALLRKGASVLDIAVPEVEEEHRRAALARDKASRPQKG